jgi:nickel/cobalt transporter (NicO) family protein
MRPARVVRTVAVGALVGLATAILPAVVSAHPLGNFSINHYNGISVTPETVVIDHVLDMSEIPTFSERAAMDLDRDGEVADAEATAWAAETCVRTAGALRVEQDGTRLAGSVASSAIAFAPGQGALTLRLECRLDWPLLAPLSEGATSRFTFRDETFAERIGWREVVVVGDGASIEDSDAPAITSSDRLLRYPPDPLASPADRSSASFAARAAVVAAGVDDGAAVDDGAMVAPATVTAAPGGDSPVPEGVPAELGALLESDGLDLVALLVALAVALGLGALHALSPGHGKTVMAAYLVGSRGTLRTAVGLGLVVTVSHTAGVLVLGAVTLGASSIVPVERLYPILGLVSGLIVLALGAYLLWGRLAAMRAPARATEHGEHAKGHDHGHEHEHHHDDDYDDAHGHSHPRPHPHPHPHPQPHATDDDGSHAHGPFRHRHTLPDRGTGWRGLASLGLAGGMVPSASALILLLGAVSVGRPELGILLTLAFGVGMAFVLAGVGVAVVVGRGAVARVGGSRIPARVVAAVPTLAGALVIAIGVVMTTQALISLELIATG